MMLLSKNEDLLIRCLAEKLDADKRDKVLADLACTTVLSRAEDYSRIIFQIANYNRPEYKGQHLFNVEGAILDKDGYELSVLLHADENDRLLELEFIRWDSDDVISPQWDTLKVF